MSHIVKNRFNKYSCNAYNYCGCGLILGSSGSCCNCYEIDIENTLYILIIY